MNIVGLAGLAGAGKDTAADILVNRFGFVKVALADPMKRICQEVFNFSSEQLWGPSEKRNEQDKRYPHAFAGSRSEPREWLTPRHALQRLGTEWGRHCYEDVWIDLAIKTAQALLSERCRYEQSEGLTYQPGPRMPSNQWRGVVVPDVRFPNELRAIRNVRGKTWKIWRPDAGLAGDAAAHSSENSLEGFDDHFDAIIVNNKSLAELEDIVTRIATATL